MNSSKSVKAEERVRAYLSCSKVLSSFQFNPLLKVSHLLLLSRQVVIWHLG